MRSHSHLSATLLLSLCLLLSTVSCGDCLAGITIKNYTTSDCAGSPDQTMVLEDPTDVSMMNQCHDIDSSGFKMSFAVDCDTKAMTIGVYMGTGCDKSKALQT